MKSFKKDYEDDGFGKSLKAILKRNLRRIVLKRV